MDRKKNGIAWAKATGHRKSKFEKKLFLTPNPFYIIDTVEPPNKGHFGANSFVPCREVVPISEVK